MNNGEGFVYAFFSNKDSLIKEFVPLESFNIEIKDYDSLYFVFKILHEVMP
ncbi:MAG: hypothetical protein IPM96_10300 [Ignavibacteria bacterium]|nr:hypothetical protein [Ignavibacteria bacterium]